MNHHKFHTLLFYLIHLLNDLKIQVLLFVILYQLHRRELSWLFLH